MLDHDFSQVYVALVDKKGYGNKKLPRYTVKPDSARTKTRQDDSHAVFNQGAVEGRGISIALAD